MALPALRASPAALAPTLLRRYPRRPPLLGKPLGWNRTPAAGCGTSAASAATAVSPLTGAEEALMGFVAGKRKATEVAHSVWKNVVSKGDSVIDATCGNGHDTLALLRMVADDSDRGVVYGMDIQSLAIQSTSFLLDESVNSNQRKLVELFCLCHSKMEDVIPQGVSIREEYETVQAFASGLPVDSWATCKLEMLNRPAAPVLILLFKK